MAIEEIQEAIEEVLDGEAEESLEYCEREMNSKGGKSDRVVADIGMRRAGVGRDKRLEVLKIIGENS